MPAEAARAHMLDGLVIEGNVEIPGAPVTDLVPDWQIQWVAEEAPSSQVPTNWQGDVAEDGAVWGRFGTRGDEVHVHLAGVGHVLARRGSRVARMYPAPGSDALGCLRRLLPYLASLGGRVVLHAACAQFERGAILLIGASGAGKSTLALALDSVGVPVLSDDHVALDPAPPESSSRFVAHASFPFVEVGQASRECFVPGAAAGSWKSRVSLRTPRPDTAVPVAQMLFLERAASISLVPMRVAESAARLMKDTLFAADLLDAEGHGTRLDGAIDLARAIPAARVTIPEGLDALSESLDELRSLFSRGLGASP